MKSIKLFFLALVLLASNNAWSVGVIHKQGVTNSAQCIAAGVPISNCLVDTCQIYDGKNAGRLCDSITNGLLRPNPPTRTVKLSGSGTYTVPAGVSYLSIRMIGAGSGGSGTSGAGNSGTDTTFGGTLLVAGGSTGPTVGGACSGSIIANGLSFPGAAGAATNWISADFGGVNAVVGGSMGAAGPFGGAGAAGSYNGTPTGTAGGSASANSGSGGGGAAWGGSQAGSGGGAGCYILDARISSLAPSYSFSVGVGGTGGGGVSGGSGGSGIIIIDEFY